MKASIAKSNTVKHGTLLILLWIPTTQNSLLLTEIKPYDKIITDNNMIINKFNEYFVNFCSNLANRILAVICEIIDFINGNYLKV